MTKQYQYDIFISHNSKDKAIARSLSMRLKKDGLRVWFDEWEIKPGDLVGFKVEKGLEQSRILILLMSEAAFDSQWVTLERQTQLFRDPMNRKRRFVPVLLENCKIPDMISQFAYVDWRKKSDDSYQKLLTACRSIPNHIEVVSNSDTEEIELTIQKIITLLPDKSLEDEMQALRGMLKTNFGQYSKWPKSFRSYLEGNELPGILLFLGDTFSMQGDHKRAEKIYTAMAKDAEESANLKSYSIAKLKQATAIERLGRPEEALVILRQLRQELALHDEMREEYWWVKYQEGICLKDLKRYREAKQIFQEVQTEAESRDRHKVSALYQLGTIDLELHDWEQAEKKFKESQVKRGGNKWDHRRAYEFRGLGLVYLAQDRFEEAAKQLKEALSISKRCQNLRYSSKIETNISQLLIKKLLQDKLSDQLSLSEISKGFSLSDSQICDIFTCLKKNGFEYLKVLNPETGQPTNKFASHNKVHKVGLWHATISVLVIDQINGNQYLLLRGRTNDGPQLRWDVSASGHRIPGEADLAAAIRKVQDEIGLTITRKQINRFGSEGEFRKVGSPYKKSERHESSRLYVYKTKKTNSEVTSVFICLVNDHQKKALTTLSKSIVKWEKLSQVFDDIQGGSQQYTSNISQLNHYRVISSLKDEINSLVQGWETKLSK